MADGPSPKKSKPDENPLFTKEQYDIFIDNMIIQFSNGVMRKTEDLSLTDVYTTYISTQITMNICKIPDCLRLVILPVLCDDCFLQYCIDHRDKEQHDCRKQGDMRFQYNMVAVDAYNKSITTRPEVSMFPVNEDQKMSEEIVEELKKKPKINIFKSEREMLIANLKSSFLCQMDAFTSDSLATFEETEFMLTVPQIRLVNEDAGDLMKLYKKRLQHLLFKLEIPRCTLLRENYLGIYEDQSERLEIPIGIEAYHFRIQFITARAGNLEPDNATSVIKYHSSIEPELHLKKNKALLKGPTRKKTSEKKTSNEITSEKLTSEKMISEEMPSAEMPSGEMTSEEMTSEEMPSEEMIFEKITFEELTFAEITFEEITSDEITFDEITTEEITFDEITTEEITSEEITSEEITSEEITSDEITSEETTSEETTSEEITSEVITSEEITSEEITTEEITSEEITSEEITSEEITYEDITSEETTSEETTSEEITSEEITSEEITSAEITSEEMTSEDLAEPANQSHLQSVSSVISVKSSTMEEPSFAANETFENIDDPQPGPSTQQDPERRPGS